MHSMRLHYGVIAAYFNHKYDLVDSDPDSLVYSTQRPDIYSGISDHKQHFSLAHSKRADLENITDDKKN